MYLSEQAGLQIQPNPDDLYLSIIIPAYNEVERIVPTIHTITNYVTGLGLAWELIIADEGSTDETARRVEECHLPNLTILRTPRNAGKGHAVQRGILAARGKYLLFTDADNATPIEELERLLAKVEREGYDIALGSRAVPGAQAQRRPIHRRILSWGLRRIVQHTLAISVKDTQCGFKLYTRAAGYQLYRALSILDFAFDLEVLYLARKLRYRIAEVPVRWCHVPGSKVKPLTDVPCFLRAIVAIKLNDWRSMYKIT